MMLLLSSHAQAATDATTGALTLCPALQDRTLYKQKENEDYAMMVAGKDGWLFRSRFDLKFRFRLTDRTKNSFSRLAQSLKSQGSDLVIVMMPTRGLVHHSKLFESEDGEQFDYRAAQRSYYNMLDELRGTGIYVADMTDVDKVENYFLKRDNHWTHEGAQFTAKAVADVVKTIPSYKDITTISYDTYPVELRQDATHRYAEFVNRICGTSIPREDIENVFETASSKEMTAENLLGGDTPAIALLGTSNSTNPQPSYANFEGFLKEYLRADVLNEAISGGSLQGSIANFLLSGTYQQTKPKIIIWEMSAHYGFNQQSFFREIIPAVHGDCGSNAVAEQTVPLDTETPILFEDLAGEELRSSQYYLALKFSDKQQRNIKVQFSHADGRHDTLRLEHSLRNFPVHNGVFFAEMSDVMEAPVNSISLEVKHPKGEVTAKICKAPAVPRKEPGPVVVAEKKPSLLSWTANGRFLWSLAESFSWLNGYFVTVSNESPPAVAKPVLPDLSGYTMEAVLAKLPPLAPGELAIDSMEGAAHLRKFAFDKRLVEFQNIQKRIDPKAIHIMSGVYDIKSLMAALQQTDHPDAIVETEKGYLVRRPIALYPLATLVIRDLDKPLLMSQQKGAFIASAGDLFVINSTVVGWDEENQKPAALGDKLSIFRPFITMWDGSRIYIAHSALRNLGYSLSKSYGVTLSTNDVIQEQFEEEFGDLPAPSGWIINSVFEQLYFGFYTYEAENVVLLGNRYKDNIIYGIDPHDRSKRLIIARNLVTGSKKKHGIIVSRDVADSYIIENTVKGNHGSGIMLDRNSSNNVVAYNLSYLNGGDGITVYESPNNLLYGNKISNNGGSGIRVRNSWDVVVAGGSIELNKNYAFQIYEDALLSTGRDFEIDPVTTRANMVASDVYLESNSGLLKAGDFESLRFENINFSKALTSRKPFAGAIRADAATLISHAKQNPSILEIKAALSQ